MRQLAATVQSAPALRVFIEAKDPVLRAHLRALVLEAGHQSVLSTCAADIVLSGGDPARQLTLSLAATQSEQAGSVHCDASPAQMDAALRAVAAGLRVRSPQVVDPGFGALDERGPEALLTPRELDVLKCIAEGLTNKLIARHLDISLHTVKFHIESLLRKLGASTRAQALAKALERRRSGTAEF